MAPSRSQGDDSAASATSFESQPHNHNGTEPIAIIGLSGVFSGESRGPSQLWEMLKAGRSSLGDAPNTRFNPKGFYHPNGERAGSSNTNQGYFIENDIRHFDAGFFSITPEEAKGMDPTQRLLLELAYGSLESGELRRLLSANNLTEI